MSENGAPASGSRRWFDELIWLAPTVAVTAFLVAVFLNNENVEVMSAVVGTVLAMLGIVIAVVTFRLQSRGPSAPRALSRRARIASRVTSVVMTLVLGALAVLWPLSDDDPDIYFGRDELRVGINGGLPGWSLGTGATASGFDVRLARFLADQYRIKQENVVFVRLKQSGRENQWTKPSWSRDVDIVISAFSITPRRLAFLDMAGPYYIDKSLTFGNAKKDRVRAGEQVKGCAVAGTTGEGRLASVSERLAKRPGANLSTETADDLPACFDQFFGPDTDVRYIASDWSIIEAFDDKGEITSADDPDEQRVTWFPEPRTDSDGREEYGVAIPEDHPRVCRDLAEKIQDFLDKEWDKTFGDTVGKRGLSPLKWHNPESVDKHYCNTDGVLDPR